MADEMLMDESVDGGIDDLEDSDTENKTVKEVLAEIVNAWLNEKFAPEILQHKYEYVECLLYHISHMEGNLKKLSHNDMRLPIYQQEIDRIRFIISSYLRLRLQKIERYVIDILKEESERSEDERLLTDPELKFAKDYAMNMETLLKSVVLQHLPVTLREFEIEKLSIKPNLHAHVMLRANRKIEGIIIPGVQDEEVDFEKDSLHIVPYKAVANLVKTGAVQLV